MNRTVESAIRFVNLTSAGLLAGSLGFGESALTPGWENELGEKADEQESLRYFNAIGPLALITSVTLAVGAKHESHGSRLLDAFSAAGLAGVFATTQLLTVPINRKLQGIAPTDYAGGDSSALNRRWSQAHAMRTVLGISAFVCAAAASALSPGRR